MESFLFKFACFDCRVSFKKPATNNIKEYSAHLPEAVLSHKCMICGNKMSFMGRQFQSPQKSDLSGWKSAQLLWEHGFRFVGNGFHNSPALPKKKPDTLAFISENKDHNQKVSFSVDWEVYKAIT